MAILGPIALLGQAFISPSLVSTTPKCIWSRSSKHDTSERAKEQEDTTMGLDRYFRQELALGLFAAMTSNAQIEVAIRKMRCELRFQIRLKYK